MSATVHKIAARVRAGLREKYICRPHTQSAHVISFPMPPKPTWLDLLRARLGRFRTAVRESQIRTELKEIAYELGQIQMLREHDNHLERIAYEEEAALRAELRDIERQRNPIEHDTEQMVD